jgi:hypothetical protein
MQYFALITNLFTFLQNNKNYTLVFDHSLWINLVHTENYYLR